MKRIALVYMMDGDNFFIEDCPEGNPEEWIDRYVYVSNVSDVDVWEVGNMIGSWTNPFQI